MQLDQMNEDDQDDETPDAIEPAPAPAPPVRPINPALQAILKSKMDLQQAQEQAQNNRTGAGLSAALSQIGHGISRAEGPADLSGAKILEQNANQPVQDVLTQQASESKAADSQSQIDDNDPDSAKSIAFRKAFMATSPKIAQAYGKDFENLTAADAPNIMKLVTQKNQNDMKEQIAGTRSDSMQEKQASASSAQQDKKDAKLQADQDKAYTTLRKDLETFRGNRPVAQASMDVYSAQKALAIVKNKDPNTLTTQDLNLLANEMGKVASGGVPGEHGVQALMPNNLQTKYAELVNFVASKPTDAQAGEYVKRNMSYLQNMTDEANSKVNSYRLNILKGYKHRVKNEDYNEAVSDYGLGGPPPGAAPATAPLPPVPRFDPKTGKTGLFDATTKAFLRWQ